jgi:hypothetical protein
LNRGKIELDDLDPAFLTTEYELYAAGDTEVIQRDETIQKLMMVWPIMSATPAAMKVLADLLTLVFPSRAQAYLEALNAGDPKTLLLKGLIQVLMGIRSAHPEVIPPESQAQLDALLQQAGAAAAQPPNVVPISSGATGGGQPQAQPATQMPEKQPTTAQPAYTNPQAGAMQ